MLFEWICANFLHVLVLFHLYPLSGSSVLLPHHTDIHGETESEHQLMFSWEIVFPIPAQAQSLIFTLCKHFADELMVSFVNCGYFKCQRG